jgi:hypothetical protein
MELLTHLTRRFAMAFMVLMLLSIAGCTRYVTPGAGVNLEAIDDYGIKERFKTKPASPFPTRIAVVRVQQSG